MSARARTQAEDTAAILQEAVRTGVPVLIPGAFEVRGGRPGAHLPAAIERLAEAHERSSVVDDRERLIYELEGGGAPSGRRSAGRMTLMTGLRRLFLRRDS